MNLSEFQNLPVEEKKKYEVDRLGCDDVPMVALNEHSIGTLHSICVVCGCCHDCEEGE